MRTGLDAFRPDDGQEHTFTDLFTKWALDLQDVVRVGDPSSTHAQAEDRLAETFDGMVSRSGASVL